MRDILPVTNMLKRFRFLFPLFVLFVLTASVAFAQDKSVVVLRRDADMTINKDGSVEVIETWVVQFQGGPFRFAFRTIPFNNISSLVFDGVSENGEEYLRAGSETPNTFTVEAGNAERTITWYFTPTTNKTRTFQLRYHLYDALRIYPAGDQFWWTFVETDRGYPINASRVTLHLPSTFELNEIGGTTYIRGIESDNVRAVDGQTLQADGGPFPPDTDWQVRVQFPHGVVTQAVQRWQQIDDERVKQAEAEQAAIQQFNFYALVATMLVAIGGGLALLVMWYMRGRDRAVALPAEFLNAPPSDPLIDAGQVLTPALAGTLIDEEANVRDVLATLIDWAQRGIIKIRALPQGAKTSDPNDDYVYEKIGTDAPPLEYAYERELMQRLFQGETSRSMGMIRQKFTSSLKEMFDDLYDELVRRGYFQARPDRVRAQFYRLGWLLMVLLCPTAFLFQIYVGITISSTLSFAWSAIAPWLLLFILAGAVMYLARFMPRKTPQGAEAAARWNAFRRYLEHIDRYTNVASAKEQFEKYLPYAVAFGIDKTWVEKFAAVDTPAPAWYIPPPSMRASTSSRLPSSTTQSSPSSASPIFRDILTDSASAPIGEDSGAPSIPSLNDAASGAFTSLNNISSSFFSMLNTTASSFVSSNPTLRPGSRSFRSGSGGASSWHSSSGSSHSFSGGGSHHSGGGGGGGRSGFG